MSDTGTPLIVTLQLDAASFARLDGLRRRHFPPERNLIPAHLTLFHALPGREAPSVQQSLELNCAATRVFEVTLSAPRFLGRGVALTALSRQLLQLRQRLAEEFEPWLKTQDRQRYHPHVTIQNKVAPPRARQLFDELAVSWVPFSAVAEGLLLWRYLGGPWELAAHFPFDQKAAPSSPTLR